MDKRIPRAVDYDDEDGFVAFVDAPAYQGFIGDWTLESIVALFDQRCREGVLAIQYVGQLDSWAAIAIRGEPSTTPSERELDLPITIRSGQLWMTTYTDLTMVAQFDDETLVGGGETEPVLDLPNGDYVLTFRWLPRTDDDQPRPVELIVTPGTCPSPERFPGADQLG